MTTPRARLLAISGATLALIVAGTAVVSAHPGDRGFGPGQGGDRIEQGFGPGRGGDRSERGFGPMNEGKRMAGLRGLMNEHVDSFVRRETTVETEDGIVTKRVDHGTATSTSDTTIEYTLATGETVTVSVDDDTQVIGFGEQTIERGLRSRTRMLPAEITLSDVAAGSQIGVWADSQDDGSFLAERIVVRPDPAAQDEADAADDATALEDSASVPVTDA